MALDSALTEDDILWLDGEIEKAERTTLHQRLEWVQFNLDFYLAGKRYRKERGLPEIAYDDIEQKQNM